MAPSSLVEALRNAFDDAGVRAEQYEFEEGRGTFILWPDGLAGKATRFVPVAALEARYTACVDDAARGALAAAAVDAFVHGAADVPAELGACGTRLLPQLWPAHKILARQMTLPRGVELPHCGLHGEEPPLRSAPSGGYAAPAPPLGVVLVCEYVTRQLPTDTSLPAIETPVVSNDLERWGVSFDHALQIALDNLRSRTKGGPPADQRWEYHPTGCAQSCQRDRFDAARAALLPNFVVRRKKRPDGLPEHGGHVVAFGTTSCVLSATSKNPLGLCFMGDCLHLKITAEDPNQLLSPTPYRLLKKRDNGGDTTPPKLHPLIQKAGEGFVWQWLPYSPGGPPLHADGEFSVPTSQREVDEILDAAAAGHDVPVFTCEGEREAESRRFAAKKEEANALFKAGRYFQAIVLYDAALARPPSDSDAAVLHANAAQALLNLAAADATRREVCAAEAFRRAVIAAQLDPSYVKAHMRTAAACELLGEPDAAAEARARADACSTAEAAARVQARAEAQEQRGALQARMAAAEAARLKKDAEEANRAALLAREQAREQAGDRDAAAAALSSMLGIGTGIAAMSGGPVGERQPPRPVGSQPGPEEVF